MYIPCEKARNLTPYAPQKGKYRIRLDANESFLLPTEADREAIARAVCDLPFNRYPDPLASEPCRAFASLYGINADCVTAGNGSDELISLIFSVFLQKGEPVLTFEPDFSMYRFYPVITENPCISLPKNADLQIDVGQTIRSINQYHAKMVIFSNPCNPTSLGLAREDVRQILCQTDALVVLDEAYMDFWDQSMLSEVSEYDNFIILRTASKALGMAALRMGFAVANPKLTGILRAAKSPYNVNAATQCAASVLLQNPMYRQVYPDLLIASRRQLSEGFLKLQQMGYIEKVYDSHTNFVLIESADAPFIHAELLDFGIAVRLLEKTRLRITGGKESENKETLAAVESIVRYLREKGKGS